ncbi:MAG: hypothetical protein ABIA93_05235 [Candidatus Woesearchaeota archaeon]
MEDLDAMALDWKHEYAGVVERPDLASRGKKYMLTYTRQYPEGGSVTLTPVQSWSSKSQNINSDIAPGTWHRLAFPSLDSLAVSPLTIPPQLKEQLRLIDTDGDGLLESYLRYGDGNGGHTLLPVEYLPGEGFNYPTLKLHDLEPIKWAEMSFFDKLGSGFKGFEEYSPGHHRSVFKVKGVKYTLAENGRAL